MAPRLPKEDLDQVLSSGERLWPDFAGAHLFITGATGFFGKWLLETLLYANDQRNLGLQITGLSRDPAVFLAEMPHLAEHAALTWITGDIRNFKFPEGKFTHIIHAATDASAKLNEEQPLAMFDTIVSGTRHTLEFAVASGVKDFLLISSGAIYGRQPPELSHISEDFRGAPDTTNCESAYAEGKRASEMLCSIYGRQYGLSPRIARCYAFIGPHLPLDTHFAAGNFLRDACAGKPITLTGNGTPYRSYMHPVDLMTWLWTILIRGEPGHSYNVGSDEAICLADLASLISRLSLTKPEVVIRGARDNRPSERYVPAIEFAHRSLGLKITIPLEENIMRTLKWLSKTKQLESAKFSPFR
jgi:dTDP-glucose 4,6-dehydratase